MQIEAMEMPALVGKPVLGIGSSRGFISKVIKSESRLFTLGTGIMKPVNFELEIVWDSGRVDITPDNIAREWLAAAERANLPAVDDVEARKAAALRQLADRRAERERQREEDREKARAFYLEAERKTPAGAKAVIVAEYVIDQSDSMTDYFGSTTARVVILGFSSHTRDLFAEMRKAARNFAETADLADAPESAEHREKYSMGGGYYLKTGYRNSTGWQIRKISMGGGLKSIPVGEWSLAPVVQASQEPARASAANGLSIEKHVHTKHGFDMWLVTMPERVSREEFDALLNMAKDFGGWYSKKWGKTPSGFAFKIEAKAHEFAALCQAGDRPEPATHSATPAGNSLLPEKLRTMADAMQKDIDHKFSDRRTNTPKRQREAASARMEGNRLQRTQEALRALADRHEAGTVPALLAGLKTKAAVYELAASKIIRNGGYYDAGRDTGEPRHSTPEALALWELLAGKSEAEKQADELRAKIERLQFANIPGYFPTPAGIVDQMLDLAGLDESGLSILEPSAGSGAILDKIRAACPQAKLSAYERHVSLREILTLKGYSLAGSDFMEADDATKYDRVLMNPPFENGQDAEHVMKAFGLLSDGGRLVAIMSPGPFFRGDRKSQAFREWFEERDGYKIDLPANSFKESGTGTATVLIVLEA